MIVLLSILVVILSYIAINYYKALLYWHNKGIKYVTPLPIFGNSLPLLVQRITMQEFIINLYNKYPNERYYGTFQYNQPILLVREPNLIKTIFIKESSAFSDHAISSNAEDDSLWGKNLFAASGENWKNLRQTISPFFTISKMKKMFFLMEHCSKLLLDQLKENDKDIFEVELSSTFKRYSAHVIASIAFGNRSNLLTKEGADVFIRMGNELTNFGGLQKFKRLLYSLHPTVRKALNLKMHPDNVANFFRTLIRNTIEYRQTGNHNSPDFVQHLLDTREGRFENEESVEAIDTEFALTNESKLGLRNKHFSLKLTEDDITAQALDFFYGGFYSTTSLIVFCMYELANNPEIQERLQEEIDDTTQENEGRIGYESLIRMKYLDMVISETLRKWPTATWIDRKSTENVLLEQNPKEKILLESGTTCWVPVFAIHRDPKYWPDPEKFNPERFDEKSRSKIQSFTFLPFGAGPRNCTGSRFAIMEAKLAIVYVFSQYEVRPTERSPSHNNPFLTPSTDFWFGFKVRCK